MPFLVDLGAAVGAAGGAGAGAAVRASADAGMDGALSADVVLFAQREGAADLATIRAARDDFVADLKKQIKAELEMTAPLDALTLHVATLGASGITLGPALNSTTTIETALGGLTGTIRIVVKKSVAAAPAVQGDTDGAHAAGAMTEEGIANAVVRKLAQREKPEQKQMSRTSATFLSRKLKADKPLKPVFCVNEVASPLYDWDSMTTIPAPAAGTVTPRRTSPRLHAAAGPAGAARAAAPAGAARAAGPAAAAGAPGASPREASAGTEEQLAKEKAASPALLAALNSVLAPSFVALDTTSMDTPLRATFPLNDVQGMGVVTGKPDAMIFPAEYAGCDASEFLEEAVGVVEWKTRESVRDSNSYPQMCFEVFAGAAESKHKAFVGLLTDMSSCGSIFSYHKRGKLKCAYRKYLHVYEDGHAGRLMPVGCAIAQLLECLRGFGLGSLPEAGEETRSDYSTDEEESLGDSDDPDQPPRKAGTAFRSAASKLALPAAAAAGGAAGGAGSKKKKKMEQADISLGATASLLASPAKPELLVSGQLHITPPKAGADLQGPPKLQVGRTTAMAPGFVRMFLSELPAHMVEVLPLNASNSFDA